jgi:hypothetical protein
MNEKTAYQKKLAHPKWQKKRLVIMQRDNFYCQYCNVADEELHVHHRYYLPNTEIWDYPDESLITLCNSCYESEENDLKELSNLDQRFRRLNLSAYEINDIIAEIEYFVRRKSSIYTLFFMLSRMNNMREEEIESIRNILKYMKSEKDIQDDLLKDLPF